jgi:hypothetical protein
MVGWREGNLSNAIGSEEQEVIGSELFNYATKEKRW